MSKHKFRLQKVLRAKEIKQKVEQRKLAEKKEELNTEEIELRHLRETEQTFLQELRPKRVGSSRGTALQHESSYQRQVQKYVEQQNTKVNSAREEVEEQRSSLLDATKETEMLDKLKTQDYQHFIYTQHHREQKRVDELSQFEPFRKNRD